MILIAVFAVVVILYSSGIQEVGAYRNHRANGFCRVGNSAHFPAARTTRV